MRALTFTLNRSPSPLLANMQTTQVGIGALLGLISHTKRLSGKCPTWLGHFADFLRLSALSSILSLIPSSMTIFTQTVHMTLNGWTSFANFLPCRCYMYPLGRSRSRFLFTGRHHGGVVRGSIAVSWLDLHRGYASFIAREDCCHTPALWSPHYRRRNNK